MTWIKLDDGFPTNPKILPLSDAAFRLYIEGLCYSGKYLTDGLLNEVIVKRMGDPEELVEAGIWEEVEGGYQIVNYTEYQTPKAEVERKKQLSRNRGLRYKIIQEGLIPFTEQEVLEKWGTDCHICGEPINLDAPRHSKEPGWRKGLHLDHVIPVTAGGPTTLENVKPAHAVCNLSKNNFQRNAEKTQPDNRIQITDTEIKKTSSNKFDDFWSAYPRKVGKRDAERAYTRALKVASFEEILEGAKRYAADPNRTAEFTAHPATWLNRGSWADEPLPPRTPTNGSQRLVTTPTATPPRFSSEDQPQGAPMPDSVRALLGRLSDLHQ